MMEQLLKWVGKIYTRCDRFDGVSMTLDGVLSDLLVMKCYHYM